MSDAQHYPYPHPEQPSLAPEEPVAPPPPAVLRPLGTWAEPTPVEEPSWPQRPSAAAVLDENAVADLIGFDTTPATGRDQATAYLAPAPGRVRTAVPTADPRGPAAEEHDPNVHHPKVPLTAAPTGRPEIERLLYGLVVNNASDLHLAHGEVARARIRGDLLPIAGEEPMTGEDIERLVAQIATPEQWAEFDERNDLDFAYAMEEATGAALTARFRVNVFRSMEHTGAVFRVIPTEVASLKDLGVPEQVERLAHLPRGLVLVCGQTGSGKSTTLAALMDLINQTRPIRIFTFEDPIEFEHTSKRALISHREIGTDTESFAQGLRQVRREDPDVILIGEMRDYETIEAAIEAADTGHLVLATVHTKSAPETISRIVSAFPADRQNQTRTTLASVLESVICQTLVKSPTSPRGRVVATEIMMVTPGIRHNIEKNDIRAIANALTDTSTGSISLDAHLAELVRSNQVKKADALKVASKPEALERYLETSADAPART